jgi:hypothetical protein
MEHNLKIEHDHFNDILNLYKRFEIRLNDRNFQVSDILHLHQLDINKKAFTGNILTVKVNYILRDHIGLAKNYVAMNIVRQELREE